MVLWWRWRRRCWAVPATVRTAVVASRRPRRVPADRSPPRSTFCRTSTSDRGGRRRPAARRRRAAVRRRPTTKRTTRREPAARCRRRRTCSRRRPTTPGACRAVRRARPPRRRRQWQRPDAASVDAGEGRRSLYVRRSNRTTKRREYVFIFPFRI